MPVPAYNAFVQAMDEIRAGDAETLTPHRIETFPSSAFNEGAWPAFPGDYIVFRPFSPVAVVVLGKPSAQELSAFAGTEIIAVAGALSTENIGIEYVIRNLVANPYIRHLVVTGKDIAGHRPGDALLRLKAAGMDTRHRIPGAQGARPVLVNLTQAEIDHFQRQLTVHDFTDAADTEAVLARLNATSGLESPPFGTGLQVELVETLEARPASRLWLDPEGYFLIFARRDRAHPLYVEHYANDGRLLHAISGRDAPSLCATILDMGLASRLDHAAYLGRELARAEEAARTGRPYVQDRAQGDLICGTSQGQCSAD